MNEAARRILTALNGAGYEAYIVGGAVRDMLMKKRPHDYDIVTSARPEEVAASPPNKVGGTLTVRALPSACPASLRVVKVLKSPPFAVKSTARTVTGLSGFGMRRHSEKMCSAATLR